MTWFCNKQNKITIKDKMKKKYLSHSSNDNNDLNNISQKNFTKTTLKISIDNKKLDRFSYNEFEQTLKLLQVIFKNIYFTLLGNIK